MKNLLTIMLLLVLCLCLCACGESKEAAATPTPAPVEEPTSTQQSVLPGATLEAAEDLRLHADGPVRVPLNGARTETLYTGSAPVDMLLL